ncbi:hypothetical protein CDHC03_0725 [Corynebacterium diphtheriae HC03]|nr:hypothetical protein CDHC03_0725 [Corynebacterium diphtheriae HC03]
MAGQLVRGRANAAYAAVVAGRVADLWVPGGDGD